MVGGVGMPLPLGCVEAFGNPEFEVREGEDRNPRPCLLGRVSCKDVRLLVPVDASAALDLGNGYQAALSLRNVTIQCIARAWHCPGPAAVCPAQEMALVESEWTTIEGRSLSSRNLLMASLIAATSASKATCLPPRDLLPWAMASLLP